MPLKDSGPPSRWHWREAIAWIAFDIPDAGDHFTIRRAVEHTGEPEDKLLLRARNAVKELVSAVRERKISTIWVGPQPGHFDGEPDDHFHVSRYNTENRMIDNLKGIGSSEYVFHGLYFNRADVIGEWPGDPVPRRASSSNVAVEARPQDAQPAPDAEPTRRQKRQQETSDRYQKWFKMARQIQSDGKKRRPIEIAKLIVKQIPIEKRTKGDNAENIRRRLSDKDCYRGWADRILAKENSAKNPAK